MFYLMDGLPVQTCLAKMKDNKKTVCDDRLQEGSEGLPPRNGTLVISTI